jgi:1,4-dihydroxy-2-naphthoate octaprenyltransferase
MNGEMSPTPPQGVKLWIAGARPRTLPAAVVPVVVGGACALESDDQAWWRIALALVVSLALQVGVNYANDYSDGVKGTDEKRVGPLRLVGSGLASPSAVKRAAFIALGVAGIAGLVLAATTSWWLLLVGAAAMVAAWTYTGGPKPYGYIGLGELFVFIFFGVVATIGSTFVVIEDVTATSVIASVAVGLFACALLVINNLRDIPGDTVAGKKTLAVRLGDKRTRVLFYAELLFAAVAIIITAFTSNGFALLGLLGVLAAWPAVSMVRAGVVGRDLIPVLGAVGRAQLVFGLTYAVGLAIAFA